MLPQGGSIHSVPGWASPGHWRPREMGSLGPHCGWGGAWPPPLLCIFGPGVGSLGPFEFILGWGHLFFCWAQEMGSPGPWAYFSPGGRLPGVRSLFFKGGIFLLFWAQGMESPGPSLLLRRGARAPLHAGRPSGPWSPGLI